MFRFARVVDLTSVSQLVPLNMYLILLLQKYRAGVNPCPSFLTLQRSIHMLHIRPLLTAYQVGGLFCVGQLLILVT